MNASVRRSIGERERHQYVVIVVDIARDEWILSAEPAGNGVAARFFAKKSAMRPGLTVTS